MKKIMLLLLTVLLIPIYSHAISIDELAAAMRETPERFKVSKNPDFIIFIDLFTSEHYMANNSTLVSISNQYSIFSSAPDYIYEVKWKIVQQGAPGSTPVDLATNGATISMKALAVRAYALDGTFLPEESKEAFEDIHSLLKGETQRERKPSAFI